jgi:hypothetical protein
MKWVSSGLTSQDSADGLYRRHVYKKRWHRTDGRWRWTVYYLGSQTPRQVAEGYEPLKRDAVRKASRAAANHRASVPKDSQS